MGGLSKRRNHKKKKGRGRSGGGGGGGGVGGGGGGGGGGGAGLSWFLIIEGLRERMTVKVQEHWPLSSKVSPRKKEGSQVW